MLVALLILFLRSPGDRDASAVTRHGAHVVIAFAKVVEVVPVHLAALEDDGGTVDTVVDGMIFFRYLIDRLLGKRHPVARLGHLVQRQRISQVNHLIRRSILEQRGITIGTDLLYLPLHRRQQHLILTRQRVWQHLHAVAGRMHTGFMLFGVQPTMLLVDELLVALSQRAVGILKHQHRGLVALQGQHHLQVVTQIIGREGIAQRQVALSRATYHATYQLDACIVIEIHTSLVRLEVILRLALRVALVSMVVAILVEHVTLHRRLDGMFALHHVELVLTLVVGLHGTCCRAHGLPINQERSTHHRNARTFVHHIARHLHASRHGEVHVRLQVALRLTIKHHRNAIATISAQVTLRQRAGHPVGTGLLSSVWQIVHHEVSLLVGSHLTRHLLSTFGIDEKRHIGDACAIGKTQIAFQPTEMLTTAFHLAGIDRVTTFTVHHRGYAIDVVITGRHRLVRIVQPLHIGSHRLPNASVLPATLHHEEIHRVFRTTPPQFHSTVVRGGCERILQDVTRFLDIEGIVRNSDVILADVELSIGGETRPVHDRFSVIP